MWIRAWFAPCGTPTRYSCEGPVASPRQKSAQADFPNKPAPGLSAPDRQAPGASCHHGGTAGEASWTSTTTSKAITLSIASGNVNAQKRDCCPLLPEQALVRSELASGAPQQLFQER